MIDSCNCSEQGSSPSPLPAELVAVGVQDATDLLDLVRTESLVEKQLLVEKLYNVNLFANSIRYYQLISIFYSKHIFCLKLK